MEFSNLFHGKGALFSPDCKYVGVICGDAIDVRFADSLLKAYKFDCRDIVKIISWSGDSVLLLSVCGLSSLRIFSVHNGSCVASLKNLYGEISQIFWAPDCRSMVFLESQLFRVTIWNLLEDDRLLGMNYIHNVQPWARPSISFSWNGKKLAVVTTDITESSLNEYVKSRDNLKDRDADCWDQITIISAITWRTEKTIHCQGVSRVGGIQWSPDSDSIAVWSAYSPDSLIILSTKSENIIARWAPSHTTFWPGLAEVVFSPSAQFLAAVSKDSRVHIMNYITWLEEEELLHQFPGKSEGIHVYQQTKSFNPCDLQFKEIRERPLSISLLAMPLKANSKSRICWSSGGRYLATCISRAPAVLWVWNIASSFNLFCVIVMEQPVQDFSWDPVYNILAVVCADDCLVLWSAEKESLTCLPVCVPVPSFPFQANYLTWRSDGKVLAVSSEQNSALLDLYATE